VEGLAPRTVADHRTYLEAFLRWWDRERPGVPPHEAAIAEAERGLSPRTRRAEVAARVAGGAG
jgi:hypothetical protein